VQWAPVYARTPPRAAGIKSSARAAVAVGNENAAGNARDRARICPCTSPAMRSGGGCAACGGQVSTRQVQSTVYAPRAAISRARARRHHECGRERWPWEFAQAAAGGGAARGDQLLAFDGDRPRRGSRHHHPRLAELSLRVLRLQSTMCRPDALLAQRSTTTFM